MEFVEILKAEVEKGFSKSDLERIIGLPLNHLANVFNGRKSLSKKSQIKIKRYFELYPDIDPLDIPEGFKIIKPKESKPIIQKVDTNEIKKYLMGFVKGGYDVVLPNFFFGWSECDVFRITEADFVVEYEIKVSKTDFYADFKKEGRNDCTKHNNLKKGIGDYCPNRFFFVVPEGLITIDEVPEYAGLLYYSNGWFSLKKNARLLHKRRFDDYKSICHTLSNRDEAQRKRISEIRNTEFDKEMAKMQRELEIIKREKREMSNEYYLLKMQNRKTNV
jgi:hypothetical protein